MMPTRADGPNEVWVWDITLLPTLVRGKYFYLYLFEDLYSRKIVGHEVHEKEDPEIGRQAFYRAKSSEGIEGSMLRLHSDNGRAMRGWMLAASLQRLGVISSFTRPSVKNDNAFVESFFRTMKYSPTYPSRPFSSLEKAQEWVNRFTKWYNTQHLHSGLKYVTPQQRHQGEDGRILRMRQNLYTQERLKNPLRWTKQIRNWSPALPIILNPLSTRIVS